jgi:hypothetical protein
MDYVDRRRAEYYKQIRRNAIVVSTQDPENEGRVQVKIPEINSVNTTPEECPWVPLSVEMSSGGVGKKECLLVGQWVTVEDTSGGMDISHEIVSGSKIKDKTLKKDNKYDYKKTASSSPEPVKKQDLNTEDTKPYNWNVKVSEALSKSIFPKIFSKDLALLKNTIFKLVEQKLLKLSMGSGSAPAEPEQKIDIPPVIDKSNDPNYYVSHFGKNLGKFTDEFYFIDVVDENDENNVQGHKTPLNQTNADMELLSTTPTGYDADGNPVPIQLNGWDLIVPPNVEGSDTGVLYEVQYKITSKEDNKSEIGTIKFRVFDNVPDVSNVSNVPETNIETKGAEAQSSYTPALNLDELKSPHDKGSAELKHGRQFSNGIVTFQDASPDNAAIGVNHPSGARQEIQHDGSCIYKSIGEQQIISESNTTIYSKEQIDIGSSSYVNVKGKKVFTECKSHVHHGTLVIIGDLTVYGKIYCTGTVKAEDFITHDGISLKNHKHKENGDETDEPS